MQGGGLQGGGLQGEVPSPGRAEVQRLQRELQTTREEVQLLQGHLAAIPYRPISPTISLYLPISPRCSCCRAT